MTTKSDIIDKIAAIIEPAAFGDTPDPMSPTERKDWKKWATEAREVARDKTNKVIAELLKQIIWQATL